MSYKISIIVPIYNVEKYISECIKSILNQTYKNFELILVDDGSSDNSGRICQYYEKSDKRIVYIIKDNGGVSSARNLGLKYAKGEYISFVDADDCLKESFLEELIKYNEYDLIIGGYKEYYNQTKGVLISNEETFYINDKNARKIDNLFCENGVHVLFYFPWNKLYKREIIISNNLFFKDNIIASEDTIFIMDYIRYAKNIIIVPYNNYLYRYIKNTSKRYLSYSGLRLHYTSFVNSINCLQSKFLYEFPLIKRDIILSYLYMYINYLKVLDYNTFKNELNNKEKFWIVKNIYKYSKRFRQIKFIYYLIVFYIPIIGFYLKKK